MRRLLCRVLLVAALAPVAPARAADARDMLARARSLYNAREFDGAVVAADQARSTAAFADAADLVAARAYLERFRASASPDDLSGARERLQRLNPARFTPAERLEFIVGLGEALFLDDAFGAAAVVFDSVLARDDGLAGDARERVLDWWASAIDRDARPRPELDRQGIYQRVRDRMVRELSQAPGSGAAAYWLAAAARGQGDLQSAWDAAEAAWVRAPLASDRGAALRADIDRLVDRALVAERARLSGQPPDVLRAEWERFKARWTP